MKAVNKTPMWKKYGLSVGGTWGVWLLLMAITYFLVIGPQDILMARLSKEFAFSNEEYNLAQSAGKQDVKNRMEQKLQTVLQKTAYFIIPQDNAAELILQISQLAAKQQLQEFATKAANVGFSSGTEDTSQINQAWLELDFKGSFSQMASFLNSLERNDPVVFIENIEMRRNTQANNLPEARVQISYLTGKSEPKKTELEPKTEAGKKP
jgi:hypothetical protein